jgi:hypothetical protein
MLKIKKGTNEYEVTGSITFRPEIGTNEETGEAILGDEQTNYSLVVDGDTITVTSLDTEWEVFEAPDPEPVVEEVPEPEPEPVPEPEPPSEEELARIAWLEQWRVYEKANRAMKALAEAGFEPTQEEQTQFDALKLWVGTNRKPEYSQYI